MKSAFYACCGTRVPSGSVSTSALYCCALDPRATSIDGVRAEGDWCLWCGEDVPEGRSFCGHNCGISYAADVAESARVVRRARVFAAVAPVVRVVLARVVAGRGCA